MKMEFKKLESIKSFENKRVQHLFNVKMGDYPEFTAKIGATRIGPVEDDDFKAFVKAYAEANCIDIDCNMFTIRKMLNDEYYRTDLCKSLKRLESMIVRKLRERGYQIKLITSKSFIHGKKVLLPAFQHKYIAKHANEAEDKCKSKFAGCPVGAGKTFVINSVLRKL
jgi:hypothetical protein